MPKRINPIDRVMEYFETAPTTEASFTLTVAQGLVRRRLAGAAGKITTMRKRPPQGATVLAAAASPEMPA